MTTYQLTQHDLPPKNITAQCFHVDDDFIRFHDADHQLVYAVQRGLLLAIETAEDEDQAEEPAQTPDPVTHFVFEADVSRFAAAVREATMPANRWLLMRQFGWTKAQVDELPDWLVSWLHEQH